MTYEERKRAGLCVRCGKRESRPGRADCELCAAALAARRGPVLSRPSVAGPFHTCCQASGFHRDGCDRRAA